MTKRFRFTDAPVNGVRVRDCPVLADGTVVKPREVYEATRHDRAVAHLEVQRLEEQRQAMIQPKGRRAGQLKAGVTQEQFYAVEAALAAAKKWVDELSFFWEDNAMSRDCRAAEGELIANDDYEHVASYPPGHAAQIAKDGTLHVLRPKRRVRTVDQPTLGAQLAALNRKNTELWRPK